MCYAGLDVGTTGVKAMAFDAAGKILAYSYRDYPLLTPKDGWCELDALQMWNACKEALQELSQAIPHPIASLAVSSQAQAVVPLDCEGKPLYHFITTVDSRTTKQHEWWINHADEHRLLQRTGLPFSSIYTVNKIMWLRENHPELYERTWKFLCVEDYITWQLTGETVIDYSLAGRGMMLNARELCWDSEILEMSGVSKELLSSLAPSSTLVGPLRPNLVKELGLDSKTQVVVGAHDQTCGCIGCGLLKPGQVMNATGTVEVLEALSYTFPSPTALIKYHYPCSPYIVGNSYLVMSINQSGGLLLKWYRDTFCQWETHCARLQGQDSYSYIIDNSSDQISDVYVLPHLNGSETPIQDQKAAGAIVHLRSCHTKSDITRGVLDSLAYEMRLNIEAMSETGCDVDEIRAIGGGARSPKLLQIRADVCQRPVLSMKTSEASALGAAIIGAVGVGAFDSYQQAISSMVQVDRVYLPNSALAHSYNDHYHEYKQLYPSLRDINHIIAQRTV